MKQRSQISQVWNWTRNGL